MSVYLPLEEKPPIMSYQGPAFVLSMLLGNRPDALPWAASAYCNMVWRDVLPWRINSRGKAATAQLDPTSYCSYNLVQEGLFSQQRLLLYPQITNYASIDMLAMIRDMLERGHYVTGGYDEYYIPEKTRYQQRHMDHAYLLYGYDDEKQQFQSIGYTNSGFYRPFCVPFEAFLQSQRLYPYGMLKTRFLSAKRDAPCAFDAALFEERVQDYLAAPRRQDGGYTGIGCLERFIAHMDVQLSSNEPALDAHHSRVIAEHAQLMQTALNQWLTVKSLDAQSTVGLLVSRYGAVVEKAQQLHNFLLKFYAVPDPKLIVKIRTTAQEIMDMEKEILSEWLHLAGRRVC